MGTVPWTDPSEINNRPQEALAETEPGNRERNPGTELACAVITQLLEDLADSDLKYHDQAILDITNPQNWLENPPLVSPSLTLPSLNRWCQIAGLDWSVLRGEIKKRYPSIEAAGVKIRARRKFLAQQKTNGDCQHCGNPIDAGSNRKPRKYCTACSYQVVLEQNKEWRKRKEADL